jgi:diacylglycerol kinase (ATP)
MSEDEKPPVDDSVLGTARIDPKQFSARESNVNRLQSLKYAVAGLLYMFRREQSIRVLTVVTVLVWGLLLWLDVDGVEIALVLLSIGVVWTAEFLNAAVEAVVDLATDEVHPMAKIAKDAAAAAVLVGVLVALSVTAITLLPPLSDKLGF